MRAVDLWAAIAGQGTSIRRLTWAWSIFASVKIIGQFVVARVPLAYSINTLSASLGR